jgi:hypothetical protein
MKSGRAKGPHEFPQPLQRMRSSFSGFEMIGSEAPLSLSTDTMADELPSGEP